jgi:hypothetical protein
LLSREFGENVDEKLVCYAVDQFAKDNLLEQAGEFPAFIIAGLNRRQMVRALGLAAVIALPLVTSIMAPTPAQAAALFPSGSPCTAPRSVCREFAVLLQEFVILRFLSALAPSTVSLFFMEALRQ